MVEETPQVRQDSEMEALKSIFFKDVVDNREAIAWNVWRPLDIMLSLQPLHSSSVAGVHCSVTLHIKCSANYPNEAPQISVHKLHGLSKENSIKLIAELNELSEKLKGEVMIYQLANHTQSFLHDHNKPTLSFYDEMLERRNELERLKQHDAQVKENIVRTKMKEEIQRRQEILKSAGRQRVHRSSISQEVEANNGDGDAPELVFYADNKLSPMRKLKRRSNIDVSCVCPCKGIQIIRISQKNNKKIHVGKCLGHSQSGATSYLSIDADTGDIIVTKKWTLNPPSDYQTRNRHTTLLEQDLKAAARLKHPSIVPYTAMEIQQEVSKRTTVQNVFLFRDYVLGCSLKYLRTKLSMLSDSFETLRLLRHIGVGVFRALKELHSAGVVHRDVRSENVFLDEAGVVKLVGAGLDVRLTEMLEEESCEERHSKAHDIYATAQLLLSFVCEEGAGQEIPSHLPSSAKDFFSRCLTDDESLQWTADQLVNHGFLRDAPAPSPGKQIDDGYSGSEDEDRAIAKAFVHQSLPASCHSRLAAEFEVLKWLGKGAFGDVLKVKNKLDGGFYAIKRIKLNPESVQLNKKITREVKLLSCLNHENVVRYYNAWIESMQPPAVDECSETSGGTRSDVAKSTPVKKKPADNMEDVVAKLAPGVKLEWSISEAAVQKRDSSSESECDDDDEEDDEDDGWIKMLPVTTDMDASSSIEFEVDTEHQSQTLPSEDEEARPPTERIQQVLYIQMEFCERNTLRHAIDAGLYLEHFRAWRLFREIVEGLSHVHQRGMIHRDLKPVNIFLDSNDHVKIGDFGLATKAFTGLPGIVDDKNKPQEEFGGSLTGQIGTALYVAPELLQAANKVIYNQKVDIYSLGVILFEMFHRPLLTGMERMKVLTDLRMKDIVMPPDFAVEENAKQIHVIRWLLNHDASARPTCPELLSSEHVPRAVPMEAVSALLAHTLSERGSKTHRRLVEACLDQRLSPAEDYTYHNDLRSKPDGILSTIKDLLIQVFKSHCATEFSPPLLVPRAKCWEESVHAVKVMTSYGSVCYLPLDLRLPFARHTAYTETKYMRRYIVDRVFREKHEGFHPREMIECAFDIVSPKTGFLWSDAELLVVGYKCASSVGLSVTITVNHTELLHTMLVCCGIPTDRHEQLYHVLLDVTSGRITNLQVQTHLTSLCITNRDISNLLRLMETEVPVSEIREALSFLTKKAEWGRAIARAVGEIETVVNNAKALGLECPVLVQPCLAYNAVQHSGVFWQMWVQREHCKAKRKQTHLLAAGGRYDVLVEEFWQIARTKEPKAELKSSSVGFSMSLERMAAFVKKLEIDLPTYKETESSKICVNIRGNIDASRDGQTCLRTAQIARELWAGGLGVCASDAATRDAREQCAAGVVMWPEDGMMRLALPELHRIREHKIPFIDVPDFIKTRRNAESARLLDASSGRSMSWSDNEKSNVPTVNVSFMSSTEYFQKCQKKLVYNQITSQVTSWLLNMGMSSVVSRARAFVLAVPFESACVRVMAAHLDAPVSHVDVAVINNLCRSFPRRKNDIEEAIHQLESITASNQSRSCSDEPTFYALYSIPDCTLRVIT